MRRLKFRREDGVAMTEFALILPIFMVIVAGLLGFGRVFFYWIQANHVANETARWAIVDRNPYAPGPTLQTAAANSATREFTLEYDGVHHAPGARQGLGDSAQGHGRQAVHVRADPQHRHDHDPGIVDDAHRALGGTNDAPTESQIRSRYTEACET